MLYSWRLLVLGVAVCLITVGSSFLVDEVLALLGGAGLVGLAVIVLCQLSGGSLGGGRLTGLGPPALATGVATFGLVAAGAVLWSLLARVTPTIWVSAGH